MGVVHRDLKVSNVQVITLTTFSTGLYYVCYDVGRDRGILHGFESSSAHGPMKQLAGLLLSIQNSNQPGLRAMQTELAHCMTIGATAAML